MVRSVGVLVLAVLVILSGFESIYSEMEVIEGGGTEESSGDCTTILTSVKINQRQLDRLEGAVQSVTPHLRETIENRLFKLQEKIEYFMLSKFEELDKKMDAKFHETKTYLDSTLTVIEDKISKYSSHVDSQLKGLESTLTHARNVSDTDACCKLCSETAALVRNTTTKINDMNVRTLNVSVKLQEINEAIQNLTDIVVPSIVNKNIPKQNDSTVSTEPAHNVPAIINTTEVNKPAPSKCDHSQQEQCCAVHDVGYNDYKVYTELSLRGRHTVVNVTSAGLQEYTMYFAVRGQWVRLILSSTSPRSDLYYEIALTHLRGGEIYMNERLPTVSWREVHIITTNNIISVEKYIYYYVTVSGDTLEVGRRGEPPLMTRTSTELKKLRYFSFMRSGSTTGEALYDCTAE